MTFACEEAEVRAALAASRESVPLEFRGATQFLGRHYAGCGATIGTMPKCDFACAGCYLNAEANRAKPRPVFQIQEQLDQIRKWLGPGGNVQITDGEVTLRAEAELVEIIAYARSIGLVPMVMSHGETFRRRPSFLEKLMVKGGLSEICIHIDTTQRGRRDQYALAKTEADLNGLRSEFANLIKTARARTKRPLQAASTVTVTRQNLEQVPGIVHWFLANADAFKMVSFQPLALVGRTDEALGAVDPEGLWSRIAEGIGDPAITQSEGWFGHPACSRFVQGLVVSRHGHTVFVPLYRRNAPEEMHLLTELLDRLGGTSFRLDNPLRAARRIGRIVFRHGRFLAARILPYLFLLLRQTGYRRPRYFCIVTHHFMNAIETETALGRERLASCAFRVPVNGRLEPMCVVNALDLRRQFYMHDSRPVASPKAGFQDSTPRQFALTT
jgi:hypothetical protein